MNPQLMSVKDAAATLSVSTKTIYRMVKAGKLRRRSVGCGEKSFRILAEDVSTVVHPPEPAAYEKGRLRSRHNA